MMNLASRLQEDYEAQQRARIERRKLKLDLILPELRDLLPKSLLRTTLRRRPCNSKAHPSAVKMCKQLPQLLLMDDPHALF